MTENLSLEEQLKVFIERKYKSVRAFAAEIDVPYTTVINVLKRGVMNSGLVTVSKICEALDLDMDSLAEGKIATKNPPDLSQRELKEDINRILETLSSETLREVKGYLSRIIDETKSEQCSDKQIKGSA